MFVVPESCRELMELQVVQFRDDPFAPWELALKEASLYARWLPTCPMRVLDLSCGLGRTTVMVHTLCGTPDTAYYLMDRSEVSNPNRWLGGWMTLQNEWCCDLQRTVAFCRANMDCGVLMPVEMDKGYPMLPVDLIISTLGVGYHWPLQPWLTKLLKFSHEKTVAVFGVREGIAEQPPPGWRLKERLPGENKQDFACFERVT